MLFLRQVQRLIGALSETAHSFQAIFFEHNNAHQNRSQLVGHQSFAALAPTPACAARPLQSASAS